MLLISTDFAIVTYNWKSMYECCRNCFKEKLKRIHEYNKISYNSSITSYNKFNLLRIINYDS